jgi:hypothetical protein
MRPVLPFLLVLSACSSATAPQHPSAMAGASSGGASAGTAATGGAGAGSGGASGASGASRGTAATGFGGYGDDTPGGKGGTVIKVTTLAASGPGSLREALGASGPRLVVFEVGGIIDLDKARLDVNEPFVTVAGHTAPSPGITLIRGGMRVFTHDVRVEHLRFRMGDAGDTAPSGFEPDVTTDGGDAYNVVFDHVSVAWGVDENLSVSGPRLEGPAATSHHVTISNSIIAEGLNGSVHAKGSHSMGTLIHDYCTNVAVVGNLYAHNDERNPWFKGYATGVVVNNVIYDPGVWAVRLGPVDSEWTSAGIVPEGPRVSVVGNVMRHGASTQSGLVLVGSNTRGSAYLEDNVALDRSGSPLALSSPSITILGEKPAWPDGLAALPSGSVVESVLARAGARPKDRDAVDARIVADFEAGSGALIDSQDQVGGYPSADPTERPLTVPGTNVDAWLESFRAEVE